MIKPDWNVFKAKFSENPQDNFEWFCYLLFCKEFDKSLGIFGYKNHRHLEHNPIEMEKEVIGWQAKFYDTSLSEHKSKIIKFIKGAKKDYPNITKIIFYTNKNWSQGRGGKQNDPKAKLGIDKEAKKLGIEIDWNHMENFFKSPFVSVDNELISKHFFTFDKSIFDFIKEQQEHTEIILKDIKTCINFEEKSIEIKRNDILEKLKNEPNQVVILSGIGGVGKTAVIKDLYDEVKEIMPFYVFKATEFELRSINEFFKNFELSDFIEAHKEEINKIIVVDSAEKLLDLKNPDSFKELFIALVESNWKIILTARTSYIDNLNYQFFEIYNIIPSCINLKIIKKKELNSISSAYSFEPPKDQKLLELIKTPFYLSEYLKYYRANGEMDYIGFKEKLWNKDIRKSKPARSECFLKMAVERVSKGSFFVVPDCDLSILDELVEDGILGYEEDKGYFITHDIYEEWALEKKISRGYSQKANDYEFFENIGQFLPIRRSFRNWISEKLLLHDKEIRDFVERVVGDDKIESVWKDEILTSVLLSDYSDDFFINSRELLLKDGCDLLRKITFLLRIACKEIDDDFFKQIGIKEVDLLTLKYILTKPKGRGWNSAIRFVYENLDTIGIENVYFILPVIHDWSGKFKTGETTRHSGLIALRYYQWTLVEDIYFSQDDDIENKVLQTILYSAIEINNELKEILEEIVKNRCKNHRDPYYDLSKAILTKLEGVSVSQVLPENVLQLADLFWAYTPKNDIFSSGLGLSMDLERCFDIEDNHMEYYPPSAFQTPIYWLLQSALQQTVDFILNFTNKTVEHFAQSDFAEGEIEEVEVFIDEKKPNKQYVCNRLWCIYRGTQTSPCVLESMHMALEKFFLENGKSMDSVSLESWLLYLLKNTRSSSISAIVASIVLAYPDKTFNVAKILFKTKEFFMYDTARLVLDQGNKGWLLSLRDSFGKNYKKDIFEEERIKACDDKHRRWSLEDSFLHYQFFRNEETSEEEVKSRQNILWEILDNYYEELLPEPEQAKPDETWRFYLARMDRRKMNPTAKNTEQGLEIRWNPEVDPELKKKSEESHKEISEKTKYDKLKLWSYYKNKNDERYKQYEKYENNPKLALREARTIVKKLKSIKKPKRLQIGYDKDDGFYLLNHGIPGEVCSVLIRDHFEILSKQEKDFCTKVILEIASLSCEPSYQYQISDSIYSVFSVLPILLEKFPEEKNNIKKILLLGLFKHDAIDMSGTSFNVFPIVAIHKLWKSNFDDAQSLLIGYLCLEPEYYEFREKIRQKNHEKNIYTFQAEDIIDEFLKKNNKHLQKIFNNQVLISDIGNLEKIKLFTLQTAFQLIPLKAEEEHKIIANHIIAIFAKKILSDDRGDKIDYMVRHRFLEKLAYFTLNAPKEEIQEYLKPFLDGFNSSKSINDMFEEFIVAEDYLNCYENFWEVWKLFENEIVDICKTRKNQWYIDKVIKSYLFAQTTWQESASEWHSLKNENKIFFKEISEKIGYSPATLYAISKLLNDIGVSYQDDGVIWISNMLDKNKNLSSEKLEVNTVYYIENIVRKYIYKNHTRIKGSKELKNSILIILDFLISKGSVLGYILRENVA